MARIFLTTYRPLCRTRQGREAIERAGLKPFIDGSCRREPDFEAVLPTITALCRGRMFAPRLVVGDRIAYVTKKGTYTKGTAPHWRLVALLQVVHRFESHEAAAAWYIHRNFPVPRNCMVAGSAPAPLDLTDGKLPKLLASRAHSLTPERLVHLWDAGYASRAKANPQVLACEASIINLTSPPVILEEDWINWIGRIPATRTPPTITSKLWKYLEERGRSAA
ncbi:MAG: hypothetical protein M3P06_25090 [Acidobacteriota bacterium]|nr:hypothetical protein [Acidobacteriota bacterium]